MGIFEMNLENGLYCLVIGGPLVCSLVNRLVSNEILRASMLRGFLHSAILAILCLFWLDESLF